MSSQVYSGVPSLFARALILCESVHDDETTVVVVDSSLTASKLVRHLADLGTRAHVIENTPSYHRFLIAESGLFVTSLDVFFQDVVTEKEKKTWKYELSTGHQIDMQDIVEWLTSHGYVHKKDDTPGTYFVQGDTIRVIMLGGRELHISLFGSTIDSLLIDQDVQRETFCVPAFFGGGEPWHIQHEFSLGLYESMDHVKWWWLGVDFSEHGDALIGLPRSMSICDLPGPKTTPLPYESIKVPNLQSLVSLISDKHSQTHIYTKYPEPIKKFLGENSLSQTPVTQLSELVGESFSWEREGFDLTDKASVKKTIIISDDILSRLFVKKRSRLRTKQRLDLLVQIKPGDHIVHLYHGIGIFRQFIKKDLSGVIREYLEIEYAGEDKLFVPIEEVHRVSKYIGSDNPTLTRLGKLEWKKTLARTQKEIVDIADKLIEENAKRQLSKGFCFDVFEDKEREFSEAFGYTHTLDQEQAIVDIYEDMHSSHAMDRLLSGDVGFGKTEVAFHAIYRAFLNAKQTLFIAPLVVLAYEHYDACMNRLAPFGVRVDILTRLSTQKEIRIALEKLKNGTTHVLIGTHRLLSPDIQCLNLGLMVVDEEHKFGVQDKEKILHIKSGVDTLSLSATPIPRSLNLALSGVKQFSILTTPPSGKEPIKTIVAGYDADTIKKAIHSELDRGGKVFYVYNRVQTIFSMKQTLEKIVGDKAKIVVTHGQMSGIELEDNIIEFKTGKYNILLTTTVIENGINFLDTNTIIIHDAQQFGLAQLHQLRGRVGRGKIHGYCYLMYGKSELSDDARERLVTIANNTHLGAGFEIAMRDMQMRGVGEILGVKQSGKTQDVGVSFYLKLLEQKIEELKEGKKQPDADCKIDLGISYFVSDDFFTSSMDKVHFYRHLESITDDEELDYLYQKTVEDHDNIPIELENLFLLSRARLRFRSWGITQVKVALGSYIFLFQADNDPENLKKFLHADHDRHVVLVSMQKAQIRENCFPSPIALLDYFVG